MVLGKAVVEKILPVNFADKIFFRNSGGDEFVADAGAERFVVEICLYGYAQDDAVIRQQVALRRR